MMYSDEELILKLKQLIADFENEVVEFKEAKANFNFNDIGKYFSALSNEANIRGIKEGWLIFGVTDQKEIVGTMYRQQGGLKGLIKEIAERTNERLTFLAIYDILYEDKRIVMFQIPPAIPGIVTQWQGAAYARENESLCPLPLNKLDIIRSQIGRDWSKDIVDDATIDDLDPEAIKEAIRLFNIKVKNGANGGNDISNLSTTEILNKAGLLIKGKITNTALILLGKEESKYLFDGFIPRITWTLYNADGTVKAYEHFDMPLLLAVDKVYAKIRNEKYRYISGQQTLFPDEVNQYEPQVVKEVINNCIAHSDYRLKGKINVEEYESKLVFINEGAFIPETIEQAIEPGYKPPYYRNTFLCNAMVNLYMIDTNSMGIPMMYDLQRKRCFPLPSYDLDTPNRVKVTIYGQILDNKYTQLLHSEADLDLQTVFILDKVQKKELISKDDYQRLKKQGLVEGRYPHIYVSFKVADIVGTQTEYVKNAGLSEETCNQLIIHALKTMKEASRTQIMNVVDAALPNVLDEKQKKKRVSYFLQKLKSEGKIESIGSGKSAKWFLK